jgi:hypothetical protein
MFIPLLTARVHCHQTVMSQIYLVSPRRLDLRSRHINGVCLSQPEPSGSTKRKRRDGRVGSQIRQLIGVPPNAALSRILPKMLFRTHPLPAPSYRFDPHKLARHGPAYSRGYRLRFARDALTTGSIKSAAILNRGGYSFGSALSLNINSTHCGRIELCTRVVVLVPVSLVPFFRALPSIRGHCMWAFHPFPSEEPSMSFPFLALLHHCQVERRSKRGG